MTMYTGYTQYPVCGYRYPAQTTTVTTGTSTKDEYVRVVRCKDCKHWDCDDGESYCDELGIFNTDMNSYCSYAKRKEE